MQSTIKYEKYFDMIFHFATKNFVAEHNEREFDMNLHFKAAQNLVTEHYGRNFDMIFHFKAA